MARAAVWTAVLALLCGCRQDMHDAPRYDALEAGAFFADGRAERPQVPGTVARAQLPSALSFGRRGGRWVEELPLPLTRELLERGHERYDIFCAICHDRAGYGQGMAVRRGVRPPPSFHTDRLRAQPVGYYFDVMTHGFGAMFDYADRIPEDDRWAIAAWVRVLQLSQDATRTDVPPAQRAALEEQP